MAYGNYYSELKSGRCERCREPDEQLATLELDDGWYDLCPHCATTINVGRAQQ